ncbi:MAG: hypothetical protein KKB31_05265 [Nanoarchaeota archaeon]|nr:hypothetical protein [Nanoarchaeota archaeon]
MIEIKGIEYEKIGMDSSALICLAVHSYSLWAFKKEFCTPIRKFYFSVESKAEFIGVLINKYAISPEDARSLWEVVSNEISLT